MGVTWNTSYLTWATRTDVLWSRRCSDCPWSVCSRHCLWSKDSANRTMFTKKLSVCGASFRNMALEIEAGRRRVHKLLVGADLCNEATCTECTKRRYPRRVQEADSDTSCAERHRL